MLIIMFMVISNEKMFIVFFECYCNGSDSIGNNLKCF